MCVVLFRCACCCYTVRLFVQNAIQNTHTSNTKYTQQCTESARPVLRTPPPGPTTAVCLALCHHTLSSPLPLASVLWRVQLHRGQPGRTGGGAGMGGVGDRRLTSTMPLTFGDASAGEASLTDHPSTKSTSQPPRPAGAGAIAVVVVCSGGCSSPRQSPRPPPPLPPPPRRRH